MEGKEDKVYKRVIESLKKGVFKLLPFYNNKEERIINLLS